jgi:hypothetical protein
MALRYAADALTPHLPSLEKASVEDLKRVLALVRAHIETNEPLPRGLSPDERHQFAALLLYQRAVSHRVEPPRLQQELPDAVVQALHADFTVPAIWTAPRVLEASGRAAVVSGDCVEVLLLLRCENDTVLRLRMPADAFSRFYAAALSAADQLRQAQKHRYMQIALPGIAR